MENGTNNATKEIEAMTTPTTEKKTKKAKKSKESKAAKKTAPATEDAVLSLRENRTPASRQVGTRFTDEEFAEILADAKKEKCTSLSNYIRLKCGFEPLR